MPLCLLRIAVSRSVQPFMLKTFPTKSSTGPATVSGVAPAIARWPGSADYGSECRRLCCDESCQYKLALQ
jgi:hypothetical protein